MAEVQPIHKMVATASLRERGEDRVQVTVVTRVQDVGSPWDQTGAMHHETLPRDDVRPFLSGVDFLMKMLANRGLNWPEDLDDHAPIRS